ncbi:MAG: TlpA family protein disulfide reductase [Cohaesibacter sp.]|nr:TlpA family protein disulfide reductase [Cohaesibacter sp.]MCV6600840.1 TlpA family protein disulfide reductase [Cohaesibacter sp.]
MSKQFLTRRQMATGLLASCAALTFGFVPKTAKAASTISPLKKMIEGSKSYQSNKAIELINEKREKSTLQSYEGRFLLVNVWATWCFSCRVEMPDLDALQGKFDPKKLLVMPISIDRNGIDAVMPFYDRTNIQHLPIFIASGMQAITTFGERGIPFSVLLDPKGKEIGRILGPVKWDADDFVAYLQDKIDRWTPAA